MNVRPMLLALISPALLSTQASAESLLNSWNIVTTGGLTATSNTETEGTVRVGGNLTATSQYRVAIHTPVVDHPNNLIVGNNASGNLTIQHGNAAIGGSLTGSISHPNGSYTTNDPSVQGIGAQDAVILQSYSSAFAAMSANNSVSFPGVQPAGVTFTIGAVDSTNHVAVFDIAGSSLFNNNKIQQVGLGFANGLDQSSVSAVVINVSGSGPLAWGSTGNFVGAFASDWARTHVIWNFTDPNLQSLTFNNASFNGSVLAPSTDVITDINSFQGSIFAKSLKQGGEVHQYLYQGYDPKITPAVPEPASLALLGISATVGLGVGLRRRRSA
jgi:choice-of-anchor A domain-containing protein